MSDQKVIIHAIAASVLLLIVAMVFLGVALFRNIVVLMVISSILIVFALARIYVLYRTVKNLNNA